MSIMPITAELTCLLKFVSVKWLAVKTASEMTYTVSSGALNSTPTNQPMLKFAIFLFHARVFGGRVGGKPAEISPNLT